MKSVVEQPRRAFWLIFALLMLPALWNMRPPWRTEGWTAAELIGVAAGALLIRAAFAALMAGFIVMVIRGASTSPERGK
jgi:hypothetical protein